MACFIGPARLIPIQDIVSQIVAVYIRDSQVPGSEIVGSPGIEKARIAYLSLSRRSTNLEQDKKVKKERRADPHAVISARVTGLLYILSLIHI